MTKRASWVWILAGFNVGFLTAATAAHVDPRPARLGVLMFLAIVTVFLAVTAWRSDRDV